MDERLAAQQIKRLTALPGIPKEAEGRAELMRALAGACTSQAHMAATIDRILEVEERCPTPAGIRQAAEFTRANYRAATQAGCCEVCSAMGGWRRAFDVRTRTGGDGDRVRLIRCDEPTWAGVTQERNRLAAEYPDRDIYDVAVPCSCALGKLRAEEMRARESARAEGRL
jgi:hypothetical protein